MVCPVSLLIACTLLIQAPAAAPAPVPVPVSAPEPAPASTTAAPVDVHSLARELTDWRTPVALPAPAFEAHFATAHSNGTEPQIDRPDGMEWVLFEHHGPGALVRIEAARPSGTLRVYLDGAEQPVVEEPLAELLGAATTGLSLPEHALAERMSAGDTGFPVLLQGGVGNGSGALLTLPFAQHCRVTCQGQAPGTVSIQWRRYEEGTAVTTLTPEGLEAARPALALARESLLPREYRQGAQSYRFGKAISYSGTGGTSRWSAMSIATGEAGPHVVSELRIGPLSAETPELLQQLLRRTILSITFDDVETVHVPLGDFFGAAPGVVSHGNFSGVEVSPEGLFTCRWPMPYQKTCFIKIEAQMDVPFAVPGLVTVEPRPWTDDTLYFHSAWQYEPYLESPPRSTWQALSVAGRGLLVGESLTVGSRDDAWRAGRARIVVDGRGHRSRGILEGLALPPADGVIWHSPLGSLPLNHGPEGTGWTSLIRPRTLDMVPFTEELRYEIGVDFPGPPLRSYAATTWFYANADARVDRQETDELAALGITSPE